MSAEAAAQRPMLLLGGVMSVWAADNVLDATGWPLYSGREDDCPLTMQDVPERARTRLLAIGVSIPARCVVVAPMSPRDWEELLVELTVVVPETMTALVRRDMIFENDLPGYIWPERFLLGLTIN